MPAIYAGTGFAIAALEFMIHCNLGRMPGNARYVTAEVPDDIAVEHLDAALLGGWAAADPAIAHDYGRTWLAERRSAVLLVPSAATGGLDLNAVVNPQHPDARRITVGADRPVAWGRRLFADADPSG